MAVDKRVNELLEKRFLDGDEIESSGYRLGFTCALERNAGLPVGPCPFRPGDESADEWHSGNADENLYWVPHSPTKLMCN